jgi:CRISPR-associated protein Csd1
VRDWLETTIPEAQQNLARYFALQELVKQGGGESIPLKLYALAAATVRDPSRSLPAEVPRTLLRVALGGGQLPNWLLYQAVKRNRAEQKVTRPRAGSSPYSAPGVATVSRRGPANRRRWLANWHGPRSRR